MARDQHMAAKFHQIPDVKYKSYDRYFNSQRSVEQHIDALVHSADSASNKPLLYCDFDAYSEVFDDGKDLRQHEVEEHSYCDPYDRKPQDLNSINMGYDQTRSRYKYLTSTASQRQKASG
ncbi:hypothetical protein CSPAE12_05296 [Colletotrichum incanum]|nr:hypothetical protein CSPAE12_05296 [Colletotrichum incanum]